VREGVVRGDVHGVCAACSTCTVEIRPRSLSRSINASNFGAPSVGNEAQVKDLPSRTL